MSNFQIFKDICKAVFLDYTGLSQNVIQDRTAKTMSAVKLAGSSLARRFLSIFPITHGISDGYDIILEYMPKSCAPAADCVDICGDFDTSDLRNTKQIKFKLKDFNCASSGVIKITSQDINSACSVFGTVEGSQMSQREKLQMKLKDWFSNGREAIALQVNKDFINTIKNAASISCYPDGTPVSTDTKPLNFVQYGSNGKFLNAKMNLQISTDTGALSRGINTSNWIFLAGTPADEFLSLPSATQGRSGITGYDVTADDAILSMYNRVFVDYQVPSVFGNEGTILAYDPAIFQYVSYSKYLKEYVGFDFRTIAYNRVTAEQLINNFTLPDNISQWQDGYEQLMVVFDREYGMYYDLIMKVKRCNGEIELIMNFQHYYKIVQMPINDFICDVDGCYTGAMWFNACLPEPETVCDTPTTTYTQPYCADVVEPDYTCSKVATGEFIAVTAAVGGGAPAAVGTASIGIGQDITQLAQLLAITKNILIQTGQGALFTGADGVLHFTPSNPATFTVPVVYEFSGSCVTWSVTIDNCPPVMLGAKTTSGGAKSEGQVSVSFFPKDDDELKTNIVPKKK